VAGVVVEVDQWAAVACLMLGNRWGENLGAACKDVGGGEMSKARMLGVV